MQDVLVTNPPALRQSGIHFCMSMPLTYALHGEVSPKLPRQSVESAESLLAATVAAANASGAHTLVLSHEGITYNPYYRSLTNYLGESLEVCRRNAEHIMYRLRELTEGFAVRIVFCPRRQDHWINANFCNAVRHNSICGITHRHIEERANDCLCYHSLVQRWANVFGESNIIIRPYEKAQMPKGSLYDFCVHVLDCPVPEGAAHTTNVTADSHVIRLHQRFNPFLEHALLESLVGRLESGPKATALLSCQDRVAILSRFEAENTRLAQQYLHRDDLFFEAAPDEECFEQQAADFALARRPKLAAQLFAGLRKLHSYVDEGLIFTALDLPHPAQNSVVTDTLLLPEDEMGKAAGLEEMYHVLVRIPRTNTPERLYILHEILCQCLGMRVRVVTGEWEGYQICSPSGECLLHVADTLFAGAGDGQWRTVQRLPASVFFLRDDNDEIPVFYGKPEVFRHEGVLHCAADIFGMCFFMLSRFEETLLLERDKFKRVPARAQFAVRQGLAKTPLVDLWAGWLARLLQSVGIVTRMRGAFALHMTHDLDFFEQDDSLLWLAKAGQAAGHAGVLNIMGLRTHACDGDFPLDAPVRRVSVLRALVRDFGYELGFHPGMDSWINKLVWRAQLDSLQPVVEKTGQPLVQGRQHYLRYAVPFTWRLWEENGMQMDTGMGYPELPGFRCGTGRAFRVFDVLARRPLKLMERPLLIMDASMHYLGVPLEEFFERIHVVVAEAKRHNTPCTALFHNSFFTQSCANSALRRKYYARWLAAF